MNAGKMDRRIFLMGAAAAAVSCGTMRNRTTYVSPNEKLNTAHIGVMGKGQGHLKHCHDFENVVALCDVDKRYLDIGHERYPNARMFRDFRVMLEKMPEIDAVVIATPDNTHAVAAMAAMQHGKHVYVEKPLTYCISETRMLTHAARKYNVATQMGNQGHSLDCMRALCEMIWSDVIGAVHEVHCWTDRPIWPQGISDPLPAQPVPDYLDWDLWLGPAHERPYNEGYHPDNWRGWFDFGTGALGDIGCHTMTTPFKVLDLYAPTRVECIKIEGQNHQTYPLKSIIRYEFPERKKGRKTLPPVSLYWYDGGLKPPPPEGVPEENHPCASSNGILFYGSNGCIECGGNGENPQFLLHALMNDYVKPEPVLERIPNEDHRTNWTTACKGGKPACSNFDFAGPLTEAVLLGNIALRARQPIEWDTKKMKVTNVPEANRLVTRIYRPGWNPL